MRERLENAFQQRAHQTMSNVLAWFTAAFVIIVVSELVFGFLAARIIIKSLIEEEENERHKLETRARLDNH
jgi:hypothetical protein